MADYQLAYTGSQIDAALAKLSGIENGANRTVTDSELNASSTNPVQNKTVCEKFQDVDAGLSAIRVMMNAVLYGFRINKNDSDPETRVEYLYDAVGMTPARMNFETGVFDYGSWGNAWFITGNRPCALKFDGSVDYYLNPNDYTQKEDGTASDVSDSSYAGNFMASIPVCWVKRWEDENYNYYAVSDRQITSDFKAYAHDAGDGTINDVFYAPMFKGVISNNKMRSIAGVTPQGNTTESAEKSAAEACGSGWQIWDLAKHELISDLLTLISRSTNSQAAFGYGAANTYDSSDTVSYGMLPSGTSGGGQFCGASDMLHHVKVFHIEDFWGNRWERCIGLNLVNGTYYYKLIRPYALEPDGSYVRTELSVSSTTEGYIKTLHCGEFGSLPDTLNDGAGSAAYECDMAWVAVTGTPVLRFGGACNRQHHCGIRCFSVRILPTYAGWDQGASPCYNAVRESS